MELPHAQHHAVSWDATTPTKSPGRRVRSCRTGADSPCRGSPAVVLAGVAFEVPGVRNVARAGGFAETPHVDEIVADRTVALHDQIVRLRLCARHPFSLKETTVVVGTTDTVFGSMPHAVRCGGAAVSPSAALSARAAHLPVL